MATGGAAECLPGFHKAMGSTPALHIRDVMVNTCDPSTQEVGTGGPGLPIWDWGKYACLCMHDHLTSESQYTSKKLHCGMASTYNPSNGRLETRGSLELAGLLT